MLVGIHTGRYSLLTKYVQKYVDILKANDIKYVLLDSSSVNFWEELKRVDYFIFHYAHYDWDKQIAEAILPVIERLGIKCFPDQNTCWLFNDKVKEYYLLKSHGLPMTESWVFYDKLKALNWIKTCAYPVIFKLKSGAGSTNVVLIKNIKDARRIVKIMFTKGINPGKFRFKGAVFFKEFNIIKHTRVILNKIAKRIKSQPIDNFWGIEKGYVLFQKFLPNNDFDTRINVVGNRAFAHRRFNRDNDFRSSGNKEIDLDPNKINLDFVKMAFKVSKEMRFQSMAYDFLYDENGNPSFCEISYTSSWNCIVPGYWDDKLKWHSGRYWLQYCELVDLLNITLKK